MCNQMHGEEQREAWVAMTVQRNAREKKAAQEAEWNREMATIQDVVAKWQDEARSEFARLRHHMARTCFEHEQDKCKAVETRDRAHLNEQEAIHGERRAKGDAAAPMDTECGVEIRDE